MSGRLLLLGMLGKWPNKEVVGWELGKWPNNGVVGWRLGWPNNGVVGWRLNGLGYGSFDLF